MNAGEGGSPTDALLLIMCGFRLKSRLFHTLGNLPRGSALVGDLLAVGISSEKRVVEASMRPFALVARAAQGSKRRGSTSQRQTWHVK